MRKSIFTLLFSFGLFIMAFGQESQIVVGVVQDNDGKPLPGCAVRFLGSEQGTITNSAGEFQLRTSSSNPKLIASFLGFRNDTLSLSRPFQDKYTFKLKTSSTVLDNLEIQDKKSSRLEKINTTTLEAKSVQLLPSTFGDFNKVLSNLPGVFSNNELSSQYSVRGGNYDENLIYVNDIPIFKPFLIRSGQQEGLSFVNPQMVKKVEFSAGGWEAKYGDKLSSVLNIQYQEPDEFGAELELGLLTASAFAKVPFKKPGNGMLISVRNKRSAYLLNTLEVQGDYLPSFTDFQAQFNFSIGKERPLEINWLLAYADNNYFVEPSSRSTDFGTFNQSFRLFVAFDGQEQLRYRLFQSGIRLKKSWSNRFNSSLIISGVRDQEREYFDLEGGYRLCDVNKNIGSENFNECVITRGIGTNFDYGRNSLDAEIYRVENRNEILLNDHSKLEFGVSFSTEKIHDRIDEYSFNDSSDFVRITHKLQSEADLNNNRIQGFLQQTFFSKDNDQILNIGLRVHHWSYNKQTFLSPRVFYKKRLFWNKETYFKAAIGNYQQSPFYREIRNFDGVLNPNIKSQNSWQFSTGLEQFFTIWGRSFVFSSEAYFKTIDNVIAYDVDDVKIRYYANNDAKAYATGADFRINGEFIPGVESWFSLGVLTTKEDVEGDGRGYIRRPSDQRVNLGIYFQDQLPIDPSIRMNLNLLYGTGLPIGPPNNFENRNFFRMPAYRRVDIGFSKVWEYKGKRLKRIHLGLDILNLLGNENVISFVWIEDVLGQQFGVPNSLSNRFFNLKGRVVF